MAHVHRFMMIVLTCTAAHGTPVANYFTQEQVKDMHLPCENGVRLASLRHLRVGWQLDNGSLLFKRAAHRGLQLQYQKVLTGDDMYSASNQPETFLTMSLLKDIDVLKTLTCTSSL